MQCSTFCSNQVSWKTYRDFQAVSARDWLCWPINIRRSSILGLVGAGGLGLVFFRQLNTFNYPGVTTVIFAILVLILFGEIVSYFVRRALI